MSAAEWPHHHPLFASDASDITLRSSDGTSYRVSSSTLQSTMGFFSGMFSLPITSDSKEATIILDEPGAVVEKLLRMISGLSAPEWRSFDDVENVLYAAEKYDAPGPISMLRYAITSPVFPAPPGPLRLYAIAVHFGWEEEAKLASKQSLSICIHDPQYLSVMEKIPSKPLMKLLTLHRKRRDEFKIHLDSAVDFGVGNTMPYVCRSCSEQFRDYSWQNLKMAIFLEMDRRPVGDFMLDLSLDIWPTSKACWEAKCPECKTVLYDKEVTLNNIRSRLDSLSSSI